MASGGYTPVMQSTGIRHLKDHLSEYLRRVRTGERIFITSHGELVAELCSPRPDDRDADTPPGLLELLRRGVARKVVRNDPASYPADRRVISTTIARELLDWDREDR